MLLQERIIENVLGELHKTSEEERQQKQTVNAGKQAGLHISIFSSLRKEITGRRGQRGREPRKYPSRKLIDIPVSPGGCKAKTATNKSQSTFSIFCVFLLITAIS